MSAQIWVTSQVLNQKAAPWWAEVYFKLHNQGFNSFIFWQETFLFHLMTQTSDYMKQKWKITMRIDLQESRVKHWWVKSLWQTFETNVPRLSWMNAVIFAVFQENQQKMDLWILWAQAKRKISLSFVLLINKGWILAVWLNKVYKPFIYIILWGCSKLTLDIHYNTLHIHIFILLKALHSHGPPTDRRFLHCINMVLQYTQSHYCKYHGLTMVM